MSVSWCTSCVKQLAVYILNGQMKRSEMGLDYVTGMFQYSSSYLNYTVPTYICKYVYDILWFVYHLDKKSGWINSMKNQNELQFSSKI